MTGIYYSTYNVVVRRKDTGEESDFKSIASSPERAREHAIEQAQRRLMVMADRQYAQFEVVSCTPAK